MLFKFNSVLYFSKYHDCKRRTEVLVLFFVFSVDMSFKVFISSSVYVTIDPGTSSAVASLSCLVELCLPFSAPRSQSFLPSRCRERKRFFMPLQELVVQFKARKNLRLTLKNAFVCFWLLER